MPHPHEQSTILLIENDDANRLLAESILKMARYRYHAVTNGQEALDWLETGHADLILTDLSMPVLDGFTLVQILRARPALDSLPIVALTASASRTERQQILRSGCTEVLVKPYRSRELIAMLDRLLPGNPEENHVDHSALFRGSARDHGAHH